jgi:hypothetical protein
MTRWVLVTVSLLLFGLVTVLLLLFGMSDARSATYFYVVAHEDDWQLFMNPNAYYDVQDQDSKVVFVYVTAGDAGLGDAAWPPFSFPYYIARENGANAAVRFMADVSTPSERPVANEIMTRGHSIHRVLYKNTISYFLRLPDGKPNGTGFGGTGHWSLERFRTGRAGRVKVVDGSASYENWRDLVDTVGELITTESAGSTELHVNIPDSDTRLNKNSHSDHVATSLLAQEATEALDCVSRVLYLDYTIRSRPINLSPEDQQIQAGVFAVTVAGTSKGWDHKHRSWLGRQYLRVERSRGCGR